MPDITPERCVRLGKAVGTENEDGNATADVNEPQPRPRPRPLLVELKSRNVRTYVLSKTKMLKDDETFETVFIKKDHSHRTKEKNGEDYEPF